MKYNIITLNDDRKVYKDEIDRNVLYERVNVPAVDAREMPREQIIEEIENRGLKWQDSWPNAKRGELGVWLSNFDAWAYASIMTEPLIVFEDDAIVAGNFMSDLMDVYRELPEDWDYTSLWVPENQRIDYRYVCDYTHNGVPRIGRVRPEWELSQYDFGPEHAALVYQGYGMVALMYSPAGGAKLVDLARRYGITGPVDCWIYEHAHMGELNGYAPKPEYAEIVTYDWSATSHVQLTEHP